MLKKIALSVVLLVFIFTGLQAQMSPGKAIRDLKKGVLIVRLKSDIKKMEVMKKRNMRATINETIENRDKENGVWMEAFEEHYKFSEVVFVFDTLRQAALESGCESCFLNSEFKIDSTISLEGRPFLMVFQGNADRATTTGARGLILKDKDFQKLSSPFPYYIFMPSFIITWNGGIRFGKRQEPLIIERTVKKLERKLNSFYEKRS